MENEVGDKLSEKEDHWSRQEVDTEEQDPENGLVDPTTSIIKPNDMREDQITKNWSRSCNKA